MLPEAFRFEPSVFIVNQQYLIALSVSVEGVMSVDVGGKTYYDDSNGILRSKKNLHMVAVPMEALDQARSYTIYFRQLIERKPYFPTSHEPVSYRVEFCPVEQNAEKINIYHISDTHGNSTMPSQAAGYFGDQLDLLVLNGDILDHSGEVENFYNLFRIAGAVTQGKIPCVFSRGNHDLRGQCAEQLADYTPTENGRSYYTFRAGPIWGVVLDCGEDKADWEAPYGHTVACHAFRLRETEFIKDLIANKETEYAAPDVKYRLVVSHVPFATRFEDPFNPEEEIYTQWCRLLREEIQPELWLAGHTHEARIIEQQDPEDHFGQPCPVVIGSYPTWRKDAHKLEQFIGVGITLSETENTIVFNDQTLQVMQTKKYPRK